MIVGMEARQRRRRTTITQFEISQVEAFANTLKSRLLAQDSALAKGYLNLLVDEIVVKDNTVTIKGSYGVLVHADNRR